MKLESRTELEVYDVHRPQLKRKVYLDKIGNKFIHASNQKFLLSNGMEPEEPVNYCLTKESLDLVHILKYGKPKTIVPDRPYSHDTDLDLATKLATLEHILEGGSKNLKEEEVYLEKNHVMKEIFYRDSLKNGSVEKDALELLMLKINNPRLYEIAISDLKGNNGKAAKLLVARINEHLERKS